MHKLPIENVDVDVNVDVKSHPVGSTTPQKKEVQSSRCLFFSLPDMFAVNLSWYFPLKFIISANMFLKQETNHSIWGVWCPTGWDSTSTFTPTSTFPICENSPLLSLWSSLQNQSNFSLMQMYILHHTSQTIVTQIDQTLKNIVVLPNRSNRCLVRSHIVLSIVTSE